MRHLPLSALAGLLLLSACLPAQAQPQPFDMTPESGLRTAPAETAPAPVAPTPAPIPIPEPAGFTRYILPFDAVQLVGEGDRLGVNVYLTQAQAEAPATLELGYLNAIVASPEASSLSILVNGTNVSTSPIASSAATSVLRVALPAGLLKQGANRVELDAIQRHRTDCSVASTYELWTQLDPATSLIRFEGADLDRITQLGDIAAIGFDEKGMTTVRLVVPGLETPEIGAAAIALVQQIALSLRVPDLIIEIVDEAPDQTPPGTLNLVMANADALPAAVAVLQPQAASGPLAAFMPGSAPHNTLVISGPEWGSVAAAARALREASWRDDPVVLPPRVDLAFPIPRVTGQTSIILSELGVQTVEFNGRRYRAVFEFALPSDFYANMYGQAHLLLDAAYSDAVLPGSQFDVYANGQIASATPVLRTDGGLFENTRIAIPMTNFRPGRNRMEVEIILLTDADAQCSPGLTQNAPNRFLFSASTRLEVPDFARAAALPDLQAFAGTGAPYAGDTPVPLLLGGGTQSMPAAMSWLARMAIASGRVVPVTLIGEAQLDPAANTLAVVPLATMPETLLARSGLARAIGTAADAGAMFDQLNQTLGGNARNPLEVATRWIADRVGLAPENFWITGRTDVPYQPQAPDAVIVAQAVQREGGVWTYLTIPDGARLLPAVQRLTQTVNWRGIGGRVSALGSDDPKVVVIQPASKTIMQTQPLSPGNIRLVAANWLSTNVLQFAALLGGVTIVLTLVTALLLRTLGRRS